MATGTISAIKKKKGFGYIAYEEPEEIRFSLSDLDNRSGNLQEGGIVSFSIDFIAPYGKVATNIRLLGSSAMDYLRVKFEAKQELTGLINKKGDKYYVKDSETQLNLPLVISKFEEEIDQNYAALENTLVRYKVVSMKTRGLIKAVLINRKFQEGYLEMVGGTFEDAKIQMRSTGGFAVTLQNDIIGFLPNSLAERTNKNFQPNDRVSLVCMGYSDDHDTLIFNTLENVMSDAASATNNLISDKEL